MALSSEIRVFALPVLLNESTCTYQTAVADFAVGAAGFGVVVGLGSAVGAGVDGADPAGGGVVDGTDVGAAVPRASGRSCNVS